MEISEITGWISYWDAAKMVAIDEITVYDRVEQARKYCQCMRVGVFDPKTVSNLDIWTAILEYRKTP
jgi:hypothetical protein